MSALVSLGLPTVTNFSGKILLRLSALSQGMLGKMAISITLKVDA